MTMLHSVISTKGLIATPRPVLGGLSKALPLTPSRPTPSVCREFNCRRQFVCEAEAQSPNESSGGFLNYALGQGTYQLLTGLLAVYSVAFAFAGPYVAEKMFGLTLLPPAEIALRAIGALLVIPTAMCYSLQSAVESNNLDSPTYKRIAFTMALALLVVCGFKFARLSQGLVMNDIGVWGNSVVQLLPSVAFIKLYGMSTMQDIIPGFISGVTSLFQPDNINSAIYSVLSAATMAYAIVAIANPTALASFMLTQSADVFVKLLIQDNGALSFLLSIALFTLKDAADRGRLGFTTFRNMNIAAFITAILKLGVCWYVNRTTMSAVGGSPVAYVMSRNSWILTIAVYGSLALVSGYNALMAKKE